jgi:membrane protease YdiL (CAAX protease family)
MNKSTTAPTYTGLILAVFGFLVIPRLTTGVGWQLSLAWVLALSLVLIVQYGERLPMVSLGLRQFTLKSLALAAVLGLLLSVLVPLLTLLIGQVIPPDSSGSIESAVAAASPLVVLLSIITAAFTEEVVFRGYLYERILMLSRRSWLAATISLAAFVAPHLANWNTAHVIGVVLPLGLVLTLIYARRRNLIFSIVLHFFIDLPLVFLAMGA